MGQPDAASRSSSRHRAGLGIAPDNDIRSRRASRPSVPSLHRGPARRRTSLCSRSRASFRWGCDCHHGTTIERQQSTFIYCRLLTTVLLQLLEAPTGRCCVVFEYGPSPASAGEAFQLRTICAAWTCTGGPARPDPVPTPRGRVGVAQANVSVRCRSNCAVAAAGEPHMDDQSA